MKCKNCGMEVNDTTILRCPRCNSIINLPNKCDECKGCSLFNGKKEIATDCQYKNKKR